MGNYNAVMEFLAGLRLAKCSNINIVACGEEGGTLVSLFQLFLLRYDVWHFVVL